MAKRITDLISKELDQLSGDAWFEASSAALRAGVPVVGREGSKVIKTHPEGHKEVLGEARPLVRVSTSDREDRARAPKAGTPNNLEIEADAPHWLMLGERPSVVVIAGPNGSGKSSLTRQLQARGYDVGEYINPDDIAAGLSGNLRRTCPGSAGDR